jgi:hypothetical protein
MATTPHPCFAALTRPFTGYKIIIHAFPVKLEGYLNIWASAYEGCTHPNRLATTCAAFHNAVALFNFRISDSYPASTCIEIKKVCLSDAMPLCAFG